MSLAQELATFKQSFVTRVPADRARMIQSYIDQSRDDDAAANALPAGGRAPDFALPNQTGNTVRLSTLLQGGPAIVVFYRGGWCPYCNLELRAYQRIVEDIRASGVRLIAISPQAPDASLSTAEKNALQFDVLSDEGSNVARAFGVASVLPKELQALYTEFGHALPDINDDDSWTLPIPATFVIGTDSTIRLAHVDVDYRQRLEPSAALAAAREDVVQVDSVSS